MSGEFGGDGNGADDGGGRGDGGAPPGGDRRKAQSAEDRLPRFRNERAEDPHCAVAMARNRAEAELARLARPDPDADVEHHLARLSVRLGVPRGAAMGYVLAGEALGRMPAFATSCAERGHVPQWHLRVVGECVAAVADEHMPLVEEALLEFLRPVREGQPLPGPRTLRRHLMDVIDALDPLAAPADDEDMPPREEPRQESVDFDERADDVHTVAAGLRPDRMLEFRMILDALCAELGCSRAEGLMAMAHRVARVDVTLNLHLAADDPDARAWLPGVGWLGRTATEEWLARATHLRFSADSRADGYRPTDSQRARVEGVDGTCRFPGCDAPAHRCDVDHVKPYDHDDPAAGGPTDTGNLHLLCRRHHNLKTARLWDVTRHPGGEETWTSVDGESLTTFPSGALAGHGRETFADHLVRRAATVRLRNLRRLGVADEDELARRLAEQQEQAEQKESAEGAAQPAPGMTDVIPET
ncbi:HNH endonuclease signature motif containing protein [Corynebacterium sp. 335C]